MNKLAKVVDKYPFKQILYLNWFEAAIAHLLLFKCTPASLRLC